MKKLYPQTVNDLLLEIDQCERLVASIASVESAIAYRKSAGFLLVKSNLTNFENIIHPTHSGYEHTGYDWGSEVTVSVYFDPKSRGGQGGIKPTS